MVGTHIGTYRLDSYLGEGGSGVVYRATHATLGRVVAIKVYNRALSPNTLRRSLQEAITLGSLRHPNIVTLFDYLEYEGAPCLVMEYVEGYTLQERLYEQTPPTPQQALPWFRALVEAVTYVHSQGIVHRDIKANNIKITPQGVVKLLDFGIALSADAPRLTTERCVIGTDEYLAPELLQGASAQPSADVWALGVLLYEIVTGKKPFASASLPDLYTQIQDARYAAPSTLNAKVPPGVTPIIARCLKRRPVERYEDAAALLADLRRYNIGAGDAVFDAPPPSRRLFWIAPVMLASIALLLISLALRVPQPPEPTGALPGKSAAQADGQGGQADAKPDGPPKTQSVGETLPASGVPLAGGEVELKVFGNEQADIYRPGETQPFASTPYTLHAPIGQKVDLILRKAGYQDKEQSITIPANKQNVSVTMDPLPEAPR